MMASKVWTVSRKALCKGPFNFVKNKRVTPSDTYGNIDNVCPATNEVVCHVPSSGKRTVDDAVCAAATAFPSWSELSPMRRGEYLFKVANRVLERADEIIEAEVLDSGKPIWESKDDIEFCAKTLNYYAGIAGSLKGDHIQLGRSFAIVRREPIGVVAGIGAWNYPVQCFVFKMAPALICGNTFVFKPSELAPLSPTILADICAEVLPEGVVNLVQGGGETGRQLCQHDKVGKISFTGSVSTGQRIIEMTAGTIKKVTLELGGKSALLCFEDADLDTAIKATVFGNFLNQGQVCSNASRVYVHESIFDTFVDNLKRFTVRMKVSDPFDESCCVGPTISETQAKKVLAYIELAKTQGASVFGGEKVDVEGCNGYFISPCIVTDCNETMKVVREEIFGSVCCVLKFRTEEEAIERANSLPYGLSAGVVTKDLNKAHRVVSKLQAGSVWVNSYNHFTPEVPFGGYKMSGLGRELGTNSLDAYSQMKSVYFAMDNLEFPAQYQKPS